MASRNGSANFTPAAFSTVLRAMCFLVMNMWTPKPASSRSRLGRSRLGWSRLGWSRLGKSGCRTLPAERIRIDDSQYNRRELVIIFRGPVNHRANLGHIEIFQLPVDSVHHKL